MLKTNVSIFKARMESGHHYVGINNYAAALGAYGAAISASSSEKIPEQRLSEAHYWKGSMIVSLDLDKISAIDEFSNAITLDQRNAKAFLRRGTEFYLLGHLDRALDDLVASANVDSQNPLTHLLAGLVLSNLNAPLKRIHKSLQYLKLTANERMGGFMDGFKSKYDADTDDHKATFEWIIDLLRKPDGI